ncbi:MAG TPA: NAD(P)H-dependent oxidoreductase, partial [Rubrobacter sp.]|nr:NAD(P)H-dependent oxidoreductase [Rubrobacter sp.]
MNVLIVYAHPEPASFNGALKDLAVEVLTGAGHSVEVSDLYAMGFSAVTGPGDFLDRARHDVFHLQTEQRHATATGTFVPEIQAEMDKLVRADLLIFQFPLWWVGPPAILKGWVDRVLAAGFSYGGANFFDQGIFRGKRALLSLTTGSGPTAFGPDGLSGPIDAILWPLQHGTFYFVGMDVLPPFVAWNAPRVGEEGRKQYLEEYRQRLLTWETTEPIPFPKLADYDEDDRLKSPLP